MRICLQEDNRGAVEKIIIEVVMPKIWLMLLQFIGNLEGMPKTR